MAGAFAVGLYVGAAFVTATVIATVGVGLLAIAASNVVGSASSPTATATYEAEEEDEPHEDGDKPASQGGGEAGSEGE